MQKKDEDKKIISILGDSVSTFAGYTPREAVFYDGYMQKETGVQDVKDTWWMQVIDAAGGVLGINHSVAGSTVSGRLRTSGTSLERLEALGENGEPDMILVSMGANDWGYGVLPQEFSEEYQNMIFTLKILYPKAEIWCSTLLEGGFPSERGNAFFNVDACISKRIYSDIIRDAAKKAEVRLADLAAHDIAYTTVDGVHPDKNGMSTIASLWIKELC